MEENNSILILSMHFYCEQQSNTVHMIYQHLLTMNSSFFFYQFIVWCNLIIEYQCDHFCKDFHQSLQSFIHKENWYCIFRKPIKTCSLYALAILMLMESFHLIKTSCDELSGIPLPTPHPSHPWSCKYTYHYLLGLSFIKENIHNFL